MRMLLLLCASALTIAMASTDVHAANSPAPTPSENWNALVDEYFDQVYFKFTPTAGTSDGLHQYDSLLEDYSRAGVDREIAALRAFEKRFMTFDPKALDETAAADRQMLISFIRSNLLELEVIRPWEKSPDIYSSGITNSIYSIMSRKFASEDDRLRSVVAREKLMPAVFDAATYH